MGYEKYIRDCSGFKTYIAVRNFIINIININFSDVSSIYTLILLNWLGLESHFTYFFDITQISKED